MKYIDAEKLIAEIERRYHKAVDESKYINSAKFVRNELEDLREFAYSLQQEQPEVDLEKETKRWWKEHLHLNPENQLWMDAHQSVVFARHFFALGMLANKQNNEKDSIGRR